jgi:hypothetical protein
VSRIIQTFRRRDENEIKPNVHNSDLYFACFGRDEIVWPSAMTAAKTHAAASVPDALLESLLVDAIENVRMVVAIAQDVL